MKEHLSDQDIERYRQRAMEPVALINANQHLAVCESCYQRFNKEDLLQSTYTFARSALLKRPASAQEHLLYDQIAAYVDENLSDKEIEKTESHLENCAQCRVDVEDLRAVKAAILSQEEIISTAPASSANVFSWRRSLFNYALQYAAIIALAIMVAWIMTLPVRKQMTELQAQLSQLRQENELLQQQYDTASSTIAELNENLTRLSMSQSLFNAEHQITFSLKDGNNSVALDHQGNLYGLESLAPSHRQIVKDALTAERVKLPPVITSLAGNPKMLMGSLDKDNYFSLLSPVGTVVMTDRPTLRWNRLDGAESYSVVILNSNAEEVATSESISSTEWSPSKPLRPGRVYRWQVRAIKNGKEIRMPLPSEPDAQFKVLERAKSEELSRAKKTYGGSPLVLGILYAQSGLLNDAELQLEALVRANPKSNVAQKLLASLKSSRR